MPVNWATTPAIQERTRELEEAKQYWNRILGGEIPLEGFSTEQRRQLINLLGDISAQYPQYDLSKAIQTYVTSALGGNLPTSLRSAALSFLADRAATTGQWSPELTAYFSTRPMSTADIVTRGDILGRTAEQLYMTPEWQAAYTALKNVLAPSGSVMAAGVPGWAALAQPYFQLAQINPELAKQLGEVQFPTSGANLSRYAQDVIKGIAEAGLAAQGLVAGPGETYRETPLQRVQRFLADLRNLVNEYIAPALSVGGVTSVPSGNAPGYTTVGDQSDQEKDKAVEDIKKLARTFGSAQEFLHYLNANQAELRRRLGNERLRKLYTFAQTNTIWGQPK